MTLSDLCLKKIVELIKKDFFEPQKFPNTFNPFNELPPTLIHDLIQTLLKSDAVTLPVEIEHLYYLLTSSPLQDFVIQDFPLTPEELNDVFQMILPSCEKLRTIKLIICNVSGYYNYPLLEEVVIKAINLKHFETNLEFRLELLQNSRHLETLSLLFPLAENWVNVLCRQRLSNCLQYINISEEQITSEQGALLLQEFKQLRNINCDLYMSFNYLYADELASCALDYKYNQLTCTLGTNINPASSTVDKYNLQKCILGTKRIPASRGVVHIVSTTCPELSDVQLTIDDDEDIFDALNNLQKLSSLSIQMTAIGKFDLLAQELQDFGRKLVSLTLINFYFFDFSILNTYCPNLNNLKVENVYGKNTKFLPGAFSNLCSLELDFILDKTFQQTTLMGILPNAVNLRRLILTSFETFDDKMLDAILIDNPLMHLEHISISKTSLSIERLSELKMESRNHSLMKP